jgi:beta-1,4-mannosyltransferase
VKRALPARAIRVVRAVRTALRADAWSQTASRLSDPSLHRLAYWPGGRQNPYLELLYSRCPEVGYVASPLTRYADLADLSGDAVFHLHWTRGAQLGAATAGEAATMTSTYLGPIESFVARGGTLLWSVHEETPHDIEFPDVEHALRRRLAELATGIHLLHESTRDAVQSMYELPEHKTFVVEHPLYTGYYPTYMGREAARRRLGLADDTALIVGFGALRPYKGFDRLLDRSADVAGLIGRPVHVLIAGPTMQHADTSELEARAVDRADATVSVGPVPTADVQMLFHAADVIALPYRKVMNSGVLMLGLTFSKVCVAPRNPITTGAASTGFVQLFDASSDDDLVAALHRALTEEHPDEIPRGFMERYDPFAIAGQFAGELSTIARTDR